MWQIEQDSDTVARMRVNYRPNKTWIFKILVTSDRHIDSTHSDINLQKKHMDEAKKHGWPVVDLGDVFDAMQGRKDPRSSRIDMKECFASKDDYFDALVDYADDFFMPYNDIMALFGLGNHETAILTHNETHLLKRLVKRNHGRKGQAILGAYSGWIKILFSYNSSRRQSVNLRYTHGYGGSAPVTKGMIQTNRRAVACPDANIIISGHTHESFIAPIARERISDLGKLYSDEQLHVQVPSYKNETIGMPYGYAVGKGMSPTPTGAAWLVFWHDQKNGIQYDAMRAR